MFSGRAKSASSTASPTTWAQSPQRMAAIYEQLKGALADAGLAKE